MMPWLSAPAVHLLQDTIRPFITNLQQWELPVAHECPSAEIQNKSALPLQIPSSESIPQCHGNLTGRAIYSQHKVILQDK